jgi:TetR/AcrR family transcriptional repressor of mexCD-oprJ operon
MNLNDEKSLAALAVAMVENPRASYQDLAVAVGVSRATLYRFCKSRDELILRLLRHGMQLFSDSVARAQLDEGPVPEALTRLVESQLAHREFSSFLSLHWRAEAELDPEIMAAWKLQEEALDRFFLRGQMEGVFRIDIAAAALNDSFIWLICGLVDAERRGRIGRAALAASVEGLFLRGASA